MKIEATADPSLACLICDGAQGARFGMTPEGWITNFQGTHACRMRHPKTMKIEATADPSLACPICDGAPGRSLRDDTGGMNYEFSGQILQLRLAQELPNFASG